MIERIKHASSHVKIEVLDITCPESVTDFINRVRPDIGYPRRVGQELSEHG